MEHDPPDRSSAEVNPYAAPREAGQPPAVDAGIGVWRDGPHLVLHRQATLPPLCIITGQPAAHFHRQTIRWSYPIDLMQRKLKLDVPLSEGAFHDWRRRRRLLLAGVLIGVVLLLLGIGLFYLLPWLVGSGPWVCGPVVLLMFAIACCVLCAADYEQSGQLLRFRRVHGEYLWLEGASASYLSWLPEWSWGT